MSYVGGNSLRFAVCAFWRVRAACRPLNCFETNTFNIHQVDRLEKSQTKNIAKHLKLGCWQERQNIYIYIRYLFVKGIDDLFLQVTNFLGHPSKTCYCSYKTFSSFWSLHLRTYESLLFWVHTQSDASGRCGKHTDLPGFMACTRCSSRVSSSLLTPVLVDIDRQVCGWNQTCQIKYFTGIQYIYIYIYACKCGFPVHVVATKSSS